MMCNDLIFTISLLAILGIAPVAMAEDSPPKIQVGDQWTYLETDDITGSPNGQLHMTVTETADKEFTLRVGPNGNGAYLIIFDYDWNAKQQAQTKYTPSDGRGAPQDAKIGTAWNTNFTWQNLDKGGGGKGQANGKCLGNEQVTTQAGTFDALKCVVTIKMKPPGGGPSNTETEMTTWFAPQTLRWAKRKFVTKDRGHLSESRTQELISYDLK